MRGLVAWALVGWLMCAPAPARADDFPIIVPPTRFEVAPVSMTSGADRALGTRMAIGIHWASASSSSDVKFDLGIGYSYENFGAPDPPGELARMPLGAAAMPPLMAEQDLYGPYLELSRRLGPAHRYQRSFVGIRAELLSSDLDESYGAGLSGRAAWELYMSVREDGPAGLYWGAMAIGAFIEIGVRRLPDGRDALRTSAGLSLRLPTTVLW